jgi:hypothetical protein
MAKTLLSKIPFVVNAGVETFPNIMKAQGMTVLDISWSPRLAGDDLLYRQLFGFAGTADAVARIDEANQGVVQAMREADPVVLDVQLVGQVVPELREHMLLHAGPPVAYENMPDPMKGAAAGAVLFEGWADSLEEAEKMLCEGAIRFDSCHHHNTVGPMGGITSPSMPVFVVEDKVSGRKAFSTMNEGIGAVMRFGANGPEVIKRLNWFKNEFGPLLGAALRHSGGIPLKPIMAKALLMGDEMHQRNTAASLLFSQTVMPHLIVSGSGEALERVVRFLGETDQFFLNLAMCAGKIMGDAGQEVGEGSIVTAMSRNGYEFGIRVSGLGNHWWTAPVNTPKGMYFAGFSEENASPDMGDSAIMETIGLGGMALPASPAVIGFVGAGTFNKAIDIFDELRGIVISNNSAWGMPALDGRPALLGIDVRKVAATGIEPLINTGIAHKQAGRGQIGAGTVTAPLGCFEAACVALGEKLATAQAASHET